MVGKEKIPALTTVEWNKAMENICGIFLVKIENFADMDKT